MSCFGYGTLVAATYRELLTSISAQAAQVIQEGQADASIRHVIPATATASVLTWMVERASQQDVPSREADRDSGLAIALTEIIWGATYLESTAH